MNSSLLILGLHRVGFPPPHAKIRGLFTTQRLLEFQIRLLKRRGYRFMTLRDAVSTNTGRRAVITFDDGYADNFTNALPVLEKHNVPATVFIVTGDVGQQDVVWEEACEDLPADILDWRQISELGSKGWEIASHADEHVHLERRSESEQMEIIGRSIDKLEAMTGESPVSFAYPYGSYNRDTKNVLKRLGIRAAVTINPTRADDDLSARDLLELPRLAVGGRHFYHYLRIFRQTVRVAGLLPEKFIGLPDQSAAGAWPDRSSRLANDEIVP
jgi:peptidoglycan/xylan/chitin deacetylase (PgdA/CDA1 family)